MRLPCLTITDTSSQTIYFVEIQFQKDNGFYARLFSEIFLYLRLDAPTKEGDLVAWLQDNLTQA
ncbi:MAG: DUF2887 domain-containing protein [Nostoc sp.]|uniref:DUF2887 domain-containing protein n=1 Tax=Nostoc sp. TaxID=1180 RepID=UPI002FF51E4C